MDNELFGQQTRGEGDAVKHATLALERALECPMTGDQVFRNFSSVRFFTESFQRHLEQLFAFEELEGYMDVVCQPHPEFTDKVNNLEEIHKQLRETLRQLVLRLERASSTESAVFDAICLELQDLIGRFRAHNQHENELLVEAFFRDTGGEG